MMPLMTSLIAVFIYLSVGAPCVKALQESVTRFVRSSNMIRDYVYINKLRDLEWVPYSANTRCEYINLWDRSEPPFAWTMFIDKMKGNIANPDAYLYDRYKHKQIDGSHFTEINGKKVFVQFVPRHKKLHPVTVCNAYFVVNGNELRIALISPYQIDGPLLTLGLHRVVLQVMDIEQYWRFNIPIPDLE